MNTDHTLASTLLIIPLSQLVESPLNPRRHIDITVMQELTESIRLHGILTPLLVRPNGESYEIAAGHRRYRAAKTAGLNDVPAIVRSMDDRAFLELLTIENLQREDLHPMDEATGYHTLMERAGYDVPAIAGRIGKSESYVYQRLKLTDLIPAAQQAFLADEFTAGHAIVIARLQPVDQKRVLDDELFDDRFGYRQKKRAGEKQHPISVRELTRWIQNNLHLDLHGASWKKDDATLVQAAGPCTTCPKRTGFAPALFPEIEKTDTCTDQACFRAKAEAFIARLEAKLKARDQLLVRLSERWSTAHNSKAIAQSQWHAVKKGSCEFVKQGVIVEGHGDTPPMPKLLTICATPSCKRHRGRSTTTAPSPKMLAEQKQKETQRKLEIRFRARLLELILDRFIHRTPCEFSKEDLRLIARRFVSEMVFDRMKRIADRRKWEVPKPRYGGRDYKDTISKAILTFSQDEISTFLIECALIGDLVPWEYGGLDEARLELIATAERVGISVSAVEQEVKTAMVKTLRKEATTGKAKTGARPGKKEQQATRLAKRIGVNP